MDWHSQYIGWYKHISHELDVLKFPALNQNSNWQLWMAQLIMRSSLYPRPRKLCTNCGCQKHIAKKVVNSGRSSQTRVERVELDEWVGIHACFFCCIYILNMSWLASQWEVSITSKPLSENIDCFQHKSQVLRALGIQTKIVEPHVVGSNNFQDPMADYWEPIQTKRIDTRDTTGLSHECWWWLAKSK